MTASVACFALEEMPAELNRDHVSESGEVPEMQSRGLVVLRLQNQRNSVIVGAAWLNTGALFAAIISMTFGMIGRSWCC